MNFRAIRCFSCAEAGLVEVINAVKASVKAILFTLFMEKFFPSGLFVFELFPAENLLQA